MAGTGERNAVAGNGDPLTEPLVRPCLVEVAEGVRAQHVQQVAPAQNDHVIEAVVTKNSFGMNQAALE